MPAAARAPDVAAALKLPFAEQIAFFRGKLGRLVPTAKWTDLWQQEHDVAFMVAGAAKADLLADLAEAVDKAIADGETRLNGTGRVLIRKSGTEPLIRVMAEAEDEAVLREVVDSIVSAVADAV